MAVLHSYSESADQTGYYLKGWTPETGHTTIQVRPICEDIFDWLEFSVGDQIPNDLLHGLLDVGLLYTGDPTSKSENIPEDFDFQTDVKNVLTEKQYNRLIGFVRSYGEEVPTRVEELIERLDAQTTVVDEEHIPDNPGGNSIQKGGLRSREVDHGRFEGIIKEVYEEDNGTELPDPLAEIDLPPGNERESALEAAADYHAKGFPITAAQIRDEMLEYVTRLPASPLNDDSSGPICGFRIGLNDNPLVAIETIIDPNTPETTLEYGESGVRHRLVISSDDFDWETVLPQHSTLMEAANRGELLEHQTTVLRMMNEGINRHPGFSEEKIIGKVIRGGYLERGRKATRDVWEESSLLGPLLAPEGTTLESLLGAESAHDKYTGTVEFFHDRKGYGFINVPGHEEDVFYHMEDVGGPDITEGEDVRFNIKEADEGPRATNIERLE